MEALIQQFHFVRPWWFLALPVLIFLVIKLRERKMSAQGWLRICDSDLLPHILTGQESTRKWPLYVIAVALFLAVIALAGPVWKKLPQPVFRGQSALVIALDLSVSMRANDVKPSRMQRAKLKVIDILRRRGEGQTGLVVYALEPFTVSPLTDDSNTIAAMVPSLDDSLMPSQGSRPALAIIRAAELLKQVGAHSGDILLMTDSADLTDAQNAVSAVLQQGYRLSVMGIGSAEGAPIQLESGELLKDRTGSIVFPKVDHAKLRSLASAGNGIYRKMTIDDNDIDAFLNLFEGSQSFDPSVIQEKKFNADVWAEEGVWLLLPLLPLTLLMFRRGWLLLLCLFLLPLPHSAEARDVLSWFKNDNQNASDLYQHKDYQQAADRFTDPRWQSAAYYKAGDYEKALESLRGLEDSTSIYNRGNILAKLGQLPEAIKAYDEVLKREPDNADAAYNRKLLQDFLKQQQQQQNQDKNQQSDRQNPDRQSEQQNGQKDQQAQDKQQAKDKQSQKEQQQPSSQGSPQDQSKQDQQQADAASEEDKQKQAEQQAQKSNAKDNDKQSEQQQQAMSEQQQNQDADQNRPLAQQQDKQREKDKQDQQSQAEQRASAHAEQLTEEQKKQIQTLNRWLDRVPDDPGGLLRRKFRYQSRAQGGQVRGVKPW